MRWSSIANKRRKSRVRIGGYTFSPDTIYGMVEKGIGGLERESGNGQKVERELNGSRAEAEQMLSNEHKLSIS